MEVLCGIYLIKCKVNDKVYIGQSKNIYHRFKCHLSRAFNQDCHTYNTILSRAIRKYGRDKFELEILELCDENDLNEREVYYIALYNSTIMGYNMDLGGGTGNYNRIYTDNQIDNARSLIMESNLSFFEISEKLQISYTTISDINTGKLAYSSKYSYPLRIRARNQTRNKVVYYCGICGVKVSAEGNLCRACYNDTRNLHKPDRESLKGLIRKLPFTHVGSLFNVSDNTIRKWCKGYNLPFRTRDIRSYTDEDWSNL